MWNIKKIINGRLIELIASLIAIILFLDDQLFHKTIFASLGKISDYLLFILLNVFTVLFYFIYRAKKARFYWILVFFTLLFCYVYFYLPFWKYPSEQLLKCLILYSAVVIISFQILHARNTIKIKDKYGEKFLSNILIIKGTKYIGKEIQGVSDVDFRQKDRTVKEHMQHIMYKLINDSLYSLDEIVKYEIAKAEHIPYNLTKSFEYEVKKFSKIENELGSFAWFINLIDPKTWLTSADWQTNYVNPMLKAAINKRHVDVRRIHSVKDSDYNDIDFKKYLIQILLKEQLLGIDNKVLKINRTVIRPDIHHIGVLIEHVFLLDYAILYSYSNSYFNNTPQKKNNNYIKEVHCSDIFPYFFEDIADFNEQDKKIYILKNFNSFGLFKEHFLLFWNFESYLEEKLSRAHNEKAQGKIDYLSDIKENNSVEIKHFFDLIKDAEIPNDQIEWDNIAEFLALIKKNNSQKLHVATSNIKNRLKDAYSSFLDEGKINRESFNKHFKSLYINDVKSLPYIF